MKNVVEFWQDFFGYFNALETQCETMFLWVFSLGVQFHQLGFLMELVLWIFWTKIGPKKVHQSDKPELK